MFSDTTEDSDFPMSNQSIKSEVIAARKSKNWLDFVNNSKGLLSFGANNESEKDKRIRRYVMAGHAAAALEEPAIDGELEEKGKTFLGNSWGMGPFYSWNSNFKN